MAWAAVLAGTLVGALPVGGRHPRGAAASSSPCSRCSPHGPRSPSAGPRATSAPSSRSRGWPRTSACSRSPSRSRAASAGATFFNGLATEGVGHIVCGIAVLSRLDPSMFPKRITGEYLPGIEIERRLAYPLNYSSGLGALCAAMGIPLLLTPRRGLRGHWSGRRRWAPPLCPYWGLHPLVHHLEPLGPRRRDRRPGLHRAQLRSPLPKLATLGGGAVTGTGSAILMAAARARRPGPGPAEHAGLEREGDEMMAIILVVCAGVAASSGWNRARRPLPHERPWWMQGSRAFKQPYGGRRRTPRRPGSRILAGAPG